MPKPAFQRVEEIFHQALAIQPEHRPYFLEFACAGDSELRAAVENLLEHDRPPTAGANLDISPIADEVERLRSQTPTIPSFAAGESHGVGPILPIIPGYELLGEVGRGGMGVVYKARQTSLHRIVALKMLLQADAVTPETLQRFRTEADALARLQHPNIVTIYDINTFEDRPYFAMEYISGPSLASMIEGRPQDVQGAAWLVEVLARAMQAVHARGIIHRDLKPGNILLANAGNSDQELGVPLLSTIPKITDFGLAKDQNLRRSITQSGTLMGTPCYMAPEQVRSKKDNVGPSADIYALGAILYEMITGRPPFEGETSADTVLQLLNDEPVPPSRIRPRLPRDLETICLKCLAKSPGGRYASAHALAEDLRRFLAGEPIQARPSGMFTHFYRWCRRNRMVAALSAVIGFLVIAFAITVGLYDWRLRQELRKDRQEIIQLNINLGTDEQEAGDTLGALLRFTEALRLAERFSEQQADHRARVAQALARCPQLVRLSILDETVLCANFSQTSRLVATTTPEHLLRVWDLAEDPQTLLEQRHEEALASASLSSDGHFLATVGTQGTARLWNLRTGKASPLPSKLAGAVESCAFHANGKTLIVREAPSAVRLWNLSGGEPVPMDGQAHEAMAFYAVSQNCAQLFTLDKDYAGRVWDLQTGKKVGLPFKTDGRPSMGAVSADGARVALLDQARGLEIWDTATARALRWRMPAPFGVNLLGFSPDGKQVLTAGARHAELWNAKTGELLTAFALHEPALSQPFFSRDGRMVVFDCAKGACIYDTATGQSVSAPLRHGGQLLAQAFSAKGDQITLVGSNGAIRTWKLARGTDGTQPLPELLQVDHLVALAQSLVGSRVDADQKSIALDTEELRSAWQRSQPRR
jgi:serine/threonine protein kinase/WD40 repeat protein